MTDDTSKFEESNVAVKPKFKMIKVPTVVSKIIANKTSSTQQTVSTASVPSPVPTINVINKSSLLNSKDFSSAFEACKIQLEQHVSPLWNKGAWNLVSNQPESVGYPIVILDDPDQAGALGYHTETPSGKIWGRVFVRPIVNRKGQMLYGPLSVSSVLSHEIMEAYCDPDVNLWAMRLDGVMVAYEIADPVENDFYEISISDGTKVSVSNFVLPSWFDARPPEGARFDYMSKVTQSFTMSKYGYMVTLNPRTGVISNVFGSMESKRMHSSRQSLHEAARSSRKSKNIGNV
jgi:hypothetical protein